MALTPLGHRVLVKPDDQPHETDTGIVLPQDRHHVPVSGTVVQVGKGPARDQAIRSLIINKCIGIANAAAEYFTSPDDATHLIAELKRYRNQIETFDPAVCVGDRVVYPVDAGLTITEDGVTYILLNEDDVAVIATESEEAAA